MGCYRQHGQSCKCGCLSLPDTGRRVCSDQEDGVVEVVHLFIKKWGRGKESIKKYLDSVE